MSSFKNPIHKDEANSRIKILEKRIKSKIQPVINTIKNVESDQTNSKIRNFLSPNSDSKFSRNHQDRFIQQKGRVIRMRKGENVILMEFYERKKVCVAFLPSQVRKKVKVGDEVVCIDYRFGHYFVVPV